MFIYIKCVLLYFIYFECQHSMGCLQLHEFDVFILCIGIYTIIYIVYIKEFYHFKTLYYYNAG